jgi:hypothetical protein
MRRGLAKYIGRKDLKIESDLYRLQPAEIASLVVDHACCAFFTPRQLTDLVAIERYLAGRQKTGGTQQHRLDES